MIDLRGYLLDFECFSNFLNVQSAAMLAFVDAAQSYKLVKTVERFRIHFNEREEMSFYND